ncbi:response regulator [Thalassobaculum sp.]|uniref:response regulator n=1 Tax=Thalassobaculum sp. TaxID=2022740 RepID=UPI0032EEF461
MSRILVIDDDMIFRSFLVALCRKRHHDVVEATDGRHAERILADETFDLVISDLFMPDKDGLEVVRGLKARGYGGPIVLISGQFVSSEDTYAKAAIAFGADAALPKFGDPADLLSHIDRFLAA